MRGALLCPPLRTLLILRLYSSAALQAHQGSENSRALHTHGTKIQANLRNPNNQDSPNDLDAESPLHFPGSIPSKQHGLIPPNDKHTWCCEHPQGDRRRNFTSVHRISHGCKPNELLDTTYEPRSSHGKSSLSNFQAVSNGSENLHCPQATYSTSFLSNIGNGILQPDVHIQSLCKHGHLLHAFDALSCIYSPLSTDTYVYLLKACNQKTGVSCIKQIHTHLTRHHAKLTGLLGEYLIQSLAKSGAIEEAVQISQTLPHLSASSWTAIISALADSGHGFKALEMHRCMQKDDVEPSSYTFVSLFKACANAQDLKQGLLLHMYVCVKGILFNAFVGNTIVTMYGKCGAVIDAENVFCSMLRRSDVAWSALLSAYAQQGQDKEALLLFRQLLEEGGRVNQHALVSALQACANLAEKEDATFVDGRSLKLASLEIGKALHGYACKKQFLADVFVSTALLTMYGKCGAASEALGVFKTLPKHDMVSWMAVMSVLVEQGEGEKALLLYGLLQMDGLTHNELAFVIAVRACVVLQKRESANGHKKSDAIISVEIGRALHADALRNGYEANLVLGTALVSMYGSCGTAEEAEYLFGTLIGRDIVSWNVMLSAYVDQGLGEKALHLYRQMQVEGAGANEATFILVFQACVTLSGLWEASTSHKETCMEIARALHADARRKGLLSNIFISNALLSLYGKCGTIAEAENVFGAVSQHDIVSWTTMLSAYIEQGMEEKALWFHRWMIMEGATLDEVAIISILQACKGTGSLEVCRQIHFSITAARHERLPSLAVTIIDMYGCCASIEDANSSFNVLFLPDVMSWTSCATGHSSGGDANGSLSAFEELTLHGIGPDEVTFTAVLSACCHAGLVEQGVVYFISMSRDYDVNVEPYHDSILVDLFGRAGDLRSVKSLLGSGRMQAADSTTWLCLLGACRPHGTTELAHEAFRQAIDKQPKESTAYVLMANMYAFEQELC